MKKLVAIIVAVMMMAGCISAFAAGNMTKEQAVQAALDYAGLKADQVTCTRVQLDWDDGRQVYEVQFVAGGIEYEMNVDVETGRVFDVDRDHFDRYDDHGWNDDWDDDRDDWDDWFDLD